MHNKACAESPEGPETCHCVCRGVLHGSARSRPSSHAEPTLRRPRKTARAAGIAVTFVAAVTIGPFVFNAMFSGSSGNNERLSMQVKTDLNKAIIGLTALGFRRAQGPQSHTSGPSYYADCAKNATDKVKQFLIRHPCKQYATASRTITRRGTTTLVAFSWVEMPTRVLGSQYKAIVDRPNTGNPPGMSLTFNGLCYASGQRGAIVWTVQVEPTGHVNADRQILQAGVEDTLPPSYLRQHCVS
jgi:hypothetical protein